ncbi:type II toxin-antitoxin system HigB family toxin [Laspinema olomoucense]|uniref:type II toxin-antitoxin system HigB family toxin n=1 Tax=Laspinema olomoucense TaxID=3231600 RepID=UPI0021BB1D1B|nr:type II toxin-antitoxin system HigB family toxin [Laspinema sp. D3a]MCT7987164.1 type II toxin-antitoxin system HigB family toxin [Laspinema sp. D3a]
MRVISRKALREFWEQHADAQSPLLLWYDRIKTDQFASFNELRQIFPSADIVKNFTVFNIGGNRYRLIVYIDYEYRMVFIRSVLTHAEYSKENWKNDEWFKES